MTGKRTPDMSVIEEWRRKTKKDNVVSGAFIVALIVLIVGVVSWAWP